MGLMLLLGVFALCVIIGLPVAFALGIAALAAFFHEGLPLLIVFQRIVAGINVYSPVSYTHLTLPTICSV